MRVGVSFLQALDRHMRVNLRRGETRVTEQRLNAAQVRAAIEQVSSEAVSKLVRADRNRN